MYRKTHIQRARIIDVRTHQGSTVTLSRDSRDFHHWNLNLTGWSIGPIGSGSAMEIDEPIEPGQIGVFTNHHAILCWRKSPDFPDIYWPHYTIGQNLIDLIFPNGRNPFLSRIRWTKNLPAVVPESGGFRLRFDWSPLRIGNFVFDWIVGH